MLVWLKSLTLLKKIGLILVGFIMLSNITGKTKQSIQTQQPYDLSQSTPQTIKLENHSETNAVQSPPKPEATPPVPQKITKPTSIPSKTPRQLSSSSTSSCDPNYSGACVPIASDVDCAGGSGNGPAYIRGPVRVIGNDIYGLDRDGDGTACDR